MVASPPPQSFGSKLFGVVLSLAVGCFVISKWGPDEDYFVKIPYTPEEIEQRKKEGKGFSIKLVDKGTTPYPRKSEIKSEAQKLALEAWSNKVGRIQEEMSILYKKRQKELRRRAVDKLIEQHRKD
ncbi:uncharacterized protein SPAPADRAFT_61065 [Spathaspora passalidarum NRRL Y-27907]|uniref:Uncharacterized protein n=1 Tax=Spathaspora passalidarum (strain NRRL Y-27907 / 11-Y1) TaxID=619300 RepID=G3ANG1_SPAPN|nr:uncharacterized protein SPAPADRAFT_61065 [Spathaspora passalidarum NRRL Y-27907]EGW31950.1 hypothetical protein SPAPADRAFT_61065 [Spathaspora passalidarum NRRL Y-27907]